MIEFCAGCDKKHESFGWKYIRGSWFCDKWFKLSTTEFVPDYIKEDRVKNAKNVVQPWRSGEPSKEFIKLYPKQANKYFTAKEISRAKDVWRDVKGLRRIQEVK